jgi:hypothetical protein
MLNTSGFLAWPCIAMPAIGSKEPRCNHGNAVQSHRSFWSRLPLAAAFLRTLAFERRTDGQLLKPVIEYALAVLRRYQFGTKAAWEQGVGG